MRLSCNTSDFSKAIVLANLAVSSKPSIPILHNIRVRTHGDDLVVVTGSDLARQIEISLSATVTDRGDLVIPSQLIADVVTKLKSESLVLADIPDDTQVLLTSDRGKYRLGYQESVDYPDIDDNQPTEPISIPAHILLAGIKRTSFAVSTDDAKGPICGVSITVTDGKIRFGATDGHRLVMMDIQTDTILPDLKLTLPVKALLDLQKVWNVTKPDAKNIDVHIHDNLITFAWTNARLTCRVLTGTYPNIGGLIPATFRRNVIVNRQTLLDTIDLIKVMTDTNNTIKVTIDENQLILAAETSTSGGVDAVPAIVSGGKLDLAFNMIYLADAIRNIATTDIQIQLNGNLEPVTILPIGDPIQTVYLVMPVQLRS